MANENENENDIAVTGGVSFVNDLTDEVKDRIRAAAKDRIETLLAAQEFTINNLAQLVGVTHGSIKNRSKSLASAEAIVTAVLNGERATSKKTANPESIKSFIDSLSAEDKAKFLAELGLTETH